MPLLAVLRPGPRVIDQLQVCGIPAVLVHLVSYSTEFGPPGPPHLPTVLVFFCRIGMRLRVATAVDKGCEVLESVVGGWDLPLFVP